ncbi:MAG TPA: hypothetical protein VFI17_10230 [Solirubrobacterales bacterium]|nr:hypothetical protein [Solirubrobacterales bacterium]
MQTLGAPPPPRRRRRRPRRAEGEQPAVLPLTRVTAIRAAAPLANEVEAARWLDEACEAEDTVDVLVGDGIALIGKALHAQAVASADPRAPTELAPEQAAAVRIGFGSGEETAAGRFSEAREVDVAAGVSRRRQRDQELRPQERVAAVLRGREHLDACETLLLRARADLDAGREREAALQLRVGLEALLIELKGALADPGHEEDMGALTAQRQALGEAANAALHGPLDPDQEKTVAEALAICERVLRRRRVLSGS